MTITRENSKIILPRDARSGPLGFFFVTLLHSVCLPFNLLNSGLPPINRCADLFP